LHGFQHPVNSIEIRRIDLSLAKARSNESGAVINPVHVAHSRWETGAVTHVAQYDLCAAPGKVSRRGFPTDQSADNLASGQQLVN
jgi:hypothetical protein